MSCKIFVSTSGTENDDWTKWLRKTIVDRCSISLGQVYWYGSSGYGVDIGKEIQQKIEESVILLCLVSDSYLVSPWCLKEHEWFCQGATSAQIPLTVLSPLVSGWPDTKSTDQTRAFFRGKLEKLKSAIHEGFGGEFIRLCTYAEEKWFPWLQEARHSDLRSTSAATLGGVKGPFRQTTDLKRLVEQLNACLLQAKKCPPGMPAGPERKSLRAVANLAAFALAADRYCDGGWGFSSADDLSYDEYGSELVRGRYDLNVVVLRALEVFLTQKEVFDEWGVSLAYSGLERQPRHVVNDRLPAVARFLSCLELAGPPGDGDINEFGRLALVQSSKIAAELSAEPPTKRWGLDSVKNAGGPSEYHIVLHEFGFHSQVHAEKDALFRGGLQECGVTPTGIELRVRELEQSVTKWLSANNIFFDVIAGYRASGDRQAVAGAELDEKSGLLRSIQWCLLAGSSRGLQLASTELARSGVVTGWDVSAFGEFQKSVGAVVDEVLKRPADCGRQTVRLLACAYVLHNLARQVHGTRFKEQFVKLWTSLMVLLSSLEGVQILFRMNSLGWALLLLLCRDILEGAPPTQGLDRLLIKKMWDSGRQLRQGRVRALSECSVEALKTGGLQSIVSENVERLMNDFGSDLLLSNRANNPSDLKQSILDSSFWGPRIRPLSSQTASGCVAGVLQVRFPSGRIDLESPGYSQLFLQPFSVITDMSVTDLMGVRRELGERDSTLVEKMGAVVVEECYERVGNRFRPSGPGGFKTRTDFVTKKLSETWWPRHLGFDDLLKLRRDKTGHRWVYRTALIQPEYGHGGNELERGFTIVWQFVEVPEDVTALIDS